MNPFVGYLSALVPEVDATLDRLLPAAAAPPERLHDAMRYCVLAGGKRIRPALTVLAGEVCGGEREQLLEPAAALELIHTFSLVHDDLPALDDDDLRRGKPTVHRRYDEALAILAGDALLSLGLATLAGYPAALGPDLRLRNVLRVATAVGSEGMIGGQVDDLEAEGDYPAEPAAALERIHRRKTGVLLVAAVGVGANCARAVPDVEATLLELAVVLGLMFQIRDDILDVEGTSQDLGKTAGKDARAGKLTYPSIYGLADSKTMLSQQRERGIELASRLPSHAELVAGLLAYLDERES